MCVCVCVCVCVIVCEKEMGEMEAIFTLNFSHPHLIPISSSQKQNSERTKPEEDLHLSITLVTRELNQNKDLHSLITFVKNELTQSEKTQIRQQ